MTDLPRRHLIVFHPLFLIALIVLIVNDHYFKSHYPGLVTGKLSDFAGLIVLPVLISYAFRGYFANRRRLLGLHVAIAVAFILWKTLPLTKYFVAISFATGFPGLFIARDITDLVALLSLIVSYHIVVTRFHCCGGEVLSRVLFRTVKTAVLVISFAAVVATTPPWIFYNSHESVTSSTVTSSARLLYIVERVLIQRGFVVDRHAIDGNETYSLQFHFSGRRIGLPPLANPLPGLYDATLVARYSDSTGAQITVTSLRVKRSVNASSPMDSLIRLIILEPIRHALEGDQ